jgi:hypothetical protein
MVGAEHGSALQGEAAMPFMAIYRRDDVSAEQYAEFRAAAPLDTVPLGALSHSHGKVGPGFVSVDVWEDTRSLEAFIQDVLIPASHAAKLTFERPQIVELETYLVTPGAAKYAVPFHESAKTPA